MITRKTQARFSFGLVVTLLVSLFCMNTSLANRADWGLVQRFQTQLEQAQNGNVKAMYEVGRMYERGRGTPKNFEEAVSWYNNASEAGNNTAKSRLGKMYLEGRGVKKDFGKAHKLLSTAAKNNVPGAQYQLAIMYEIGVGINEDPNEAQYWYKKAAALGHYQAERKAKKLSDTTGTPFIANESKSRAQTKTKANTSKSAAGANTTIDAIAKGSWKRRKRPAGYLPSSINNCKKSDKKTLVCISTEQERNTGSEVITFNTETTITSAGNKKFVIEYTNNVLEIELVQNETASGVEEDEESSSTTARKNAIQKGKQDKLHRLDCTLKNSKTVSCIKNKTRTLEFKS